MNLIRKGFSAIKNIKPTRSFKVNYATLPNDQGQKVKNSIGPVSLTSLGLFLATGAGLYYYLGQEKQKVEIERGQRIKRENEKSFGKPKLGGNFELTDHFGNKFNQDNLLNKYSIIYFGFTHCPDICPDELDKMSEIVEAVENDSSLKNKLTPIFITCDPLRDSPEVIKEYLNDFHPKFIGLTGTIDDIAKTCKAYRVYYSKPPKVNPGEDYLVDHSIFFYLMDPNGQFVDCYGKDKTAEQAFYSIKGYLSENL
ncbi:cytochrome c oxidase-like protein [Neoconidiobolus thromboides FSU 785]|nr:cytochrome c oxidase-like protein [Neoconidiobolus thromboides FSU 785]